jgi:hypothetical protein
MKLFLGLVCVSLGLTACKDDYFDQEKYDERLMKAFPVQNVDPQHTWATYGSAVADLRVSGDYGEKYRVAVYQENPLITSPVTQLAETVVKSGEQVQLGFAYPLAHPIVYMVCFDSKNRNVVKAVNAADPDALYVDFFGQSAKARRFTSSSFWPVAVTRASTTFDIYTNNNPGILGWNEVNQGGEMRINIDLTNNVKGMLDSGTWTIGVDYTCEQYSNEDDRWYQIQFMGTWWTRFEGAIGVNGATKSDDGNILIPLAANSTNVEVTLTSTDRSTLKNQGVCLVGHGIRVSRVYLKGETEGSGNDDSGDNDIAPVTPGVVDNADKLANTTYQAEGYFKTREAEMSVSEWVNAVGLSAVSSNEISVVNVVMNTIDTSNSFISMTTQSLQDNQNDNRSNKWWRVETGTNLTGFGNYNFNASETIVNDAVVYIKGTLHLTSAQSSQKGITYIVGSGGKLILEESMTFEVGNRVVVMEGGDLIVKNNANITFSGKKKSMGFYNAGNVTFPGKLTFNNAELGFIYNVGELSINEVENVRNLYNFGTLYIEEDFEIGQNADDRKFKYNLYNQGYMEVANVTASNAVNYGELNGTTLDVSDEFYFNAGTSELTSVSCKELTNFGTLTIANRYDPNKGDWATINACYLHITDATADNLFRRLVMLANSRLDIEGSMSFQEDNNSRWEDKSVVNVKGNFTVADDGAKWDCPTGDGYAVLKIGGNISMDKWTNVTRKNDGNLYLDWAKMGQAVSATTFTQSLTDNLTKEDAVSMMLATLASAFVEESTATPNISIQEGECTGSGYNAKITTTGKTYEVNPVSYRFCFEDNFPTPGDYDFNDCVMTVTPSVNAEGTQATIVMTLDAVGATKQISAALRINGLNTTDITAATRTGFSDYVLEKNYTQRQVIKNTTTPAGWEGVNIVTGDNLGWKYNNNAYEAISSSEFAISLFNDAHWVISGEGPDIGGRIDALHWYFFNTVDPNITHEEARTAKRAKLTLTFSIAEGQQQKVQNIFSNPANFDLFIVENHDGRKWEVHTVPYKFDQVLREHTGGSIGKASTKLATYAQGATANFPWAIQVPGNVRYPIEWQSISGTLLGSEYGSETAAYGKFYLWAQNHNSNANWYETDMHNELLYPLLTDTNE